MADVNMQENLNILWSECQQILKDNLSPSAYQTWFAPVEAIQWDNNVLVLQVRSQFIVDYIEENYLNLLSRALGTFGSGNLRTHRYEPDASEEEAKVRK